MLLQRSFGVSLFAAAASEQKKIKMSAGWRGYAGDVSTMSLVLFNLIVKTIEDERQPNRANIALSPLPPLSPCRPPRTSAPSFPRLSLRALYRPFQPGA
jgi:hypothetical protein